MSAEVIQFDREGIKHRERRTKQRELEEARRGGYFTNAEFLAICEAAPPEERLRIWRSMQEVMATPAEREIEQLAARVHAARPDLSSKACDTIARRLQSTAGPQCSKAWARREQQNGDPFYALVARIEAARPDLGWSASLTCAHKIEKGSLTFEQVVKGEQLTAEIVRPLAALRDAFKKAEAAYYEVVRDLARRTGRSAKSVTHVLHSVRKGRLNRPT